MRSLPIRLLSFLSPLLALPFLLLPRTAGAQQSQNYPLDEKGDSLMEVTHVFSSLPPGGYTAVRVSVKNASGKTIPISLTADSRSQADRDPHTLNSAGFSFEAKAGATTAREFIVPLMADFSVSRGGYGEYSSLYLSLTAGGGGGFSANYSSSKEDGQPFVAFSQSITGKALSDLNSAMRDKASGGSSSSSYRREGGFAASYQAPQLPSDWRAYTGLDALVMTPEEWLGLSPGVTTAIRQWVILGGCLDFFVTGPPPPGILQQLKPDRAEDGIQRLGAGSLRLLAWAGGTPYEPITDAKLKSSGVLLLDWAGEIVPDSSTGGVSGDFEGIIGKYWRYGSPSGGKTPGAPGLKVRHAVARNEFRSSAALADALGLRNFAAWQVGVILLLFGVLVGPVNLFYFAGHGRRHRLFFTTPLISLGASAVLILVIMFQDGAGGSGSRAALIEIRPEDNSAYIRQYQVSRTGVLFGGGFATEEPALITPLVLAPSRWTRLKPSDFSGSEGQHYTAPDPLGYGGDWFQSRSEQAQLLETIRPGRGRLELKSGGASPMIVSSLSCSLERLFYTDPAGRVWTAQSPLGTGGTATLREAADTEFQDFLREQSRMFPMGSLDSAGNSRFIALSRDAQAGFSPTLKSIKWQDNLAVLQGPLGAPSAAAPAPATQP